MWAGVGGCRDVVKLPDHHQLSTTLGSAQDSKVHNSSIDFAPNRPFPIVLSILVEAKAVAIPESILHFYWR